MYVGAYATSPSVTPTSRAPDGEETLFYAGLRTLPTLGGYEVPLLPGGTLHALDEPWLISQLVQPVHSTPTPSVMLTLIPVTMVTLSQQPTFGLASTDEVGRQAAVEVVRAACAAAGRLKAAAGGRGVVKFVELHSGPSRSKGTSSSAALQRSLVEVRAWDWGGAELLLEHCDAMADVGGVATSAYPPAKGFLTIKEEVEAVRGALLSAGGAPIGICINWARSVLETRDTSTPLAHARAAGELLHGVVFSGCSGEGVYGEWLDSHAPLRGEGGGPLLCRESLLGEKEVGEFGEGLGGEGKARLGVVGVKITCKGEKGQPEPTPGDRVGANREILGCVGKFFAPLK